MNKRAKRSLKEFHTASMHRMADANTKDAPTEPLFHYTSEQALFSIIKQELLYFTSVFHMDDDEELSFGFGVSRALLKARIIKGQAITNVFLKPLAEGDDLEKIKELFCFYSVSFGQRNDPDQWARYGDSGRGVAVGFRPPFFGIEVKDSYEPDEMIYLGKVAYGEAAAERRHETVIDEALKTFRNAFQQGWLLKENDEIDFMRDLGASMYVEILWNAVNTKTDKWSAQRETRLLAVNNLKKPQRKIHNAPLRPRLELPQPKLKANIAEIIVGPQADSAAEERITEFLHVQNLANVPIIRAVHKRH